MNKLNFSNEEKNMLLNKPYAHRGIFDNKNVPENSISSFRLALDNNFNIELDVRITLDNKVIVFHDRNLNRMCGLNKVIENCTYDELKKYKLLNTKETIPLLVDVLNLVNGRVCLLIETKSDNHNNRLESLLSQILDTYNGLFAIQSFNYSSVYWFKHNKKNYIVGALVKDSIKLFKFINKIAFLDKILGVDFISFDIRVKPNRSLIKFKNKKPILGWTFKTPDDFKSKNKFFNCIIAESEILLKK